MSRVSPALRTWFIIHEVVDAVVMIALALDPEAVFAVMSWPGGDPILARMFAAALFAIGGISWIARDASVEVYRVLLDLKLLWAGGIVIALFISWIAVPSPCLAVVGILFAGFFSLWAYFRSELEG